MTAIRVLLVDDQPLIRTGLRRILRLRTGFDVVGECDDGSGVLEEIARCHPDVIVMDLRMRDVDGIEATRRVVDAGGPPVLVLTTFDDDESLGGALRAGANGFCLKHAEGEELLQAVRSVAEGGAWIDPSICGRVLAAYRAATGRRLTAPATGDVAARLGSLTSKEAEVLQLVARGLTNGEIATDLHVGEATVKTHISRIFSKLAVRDRAAAIVFAYDHGIVNPPV